MRHSKSVRHSRYPVIFFDGECNLCNGFVQYVIRHDKKALFRFSSLQSDYARRLGHDYPQASDGSLESMVVDWDGRLLKYSDGVLSVLRHLGGLHPLTRIFYLIPRSLRDRIYRWLARRRYFFFGKAETCMVPVPGIESRFLMDA